MLTDLQIQEFRDKGFLAIPDFSSKDQVEEMRNSGLQLLENIDPESISVFSTKNQTKKTDQYFLDSANQISFFFEEGAFDDNGTLTKPKALAINKIGHALHELDPTFRKWTRENPKIAEVLRDLGYCRPLPVQSMLIFKQPGIGGEVVPHQDSTFLATDPLSVVGLWIALEDATIENGCLWALAGSHKNGVYKKFIRAEDNSVSFTGELPEVDDSRFEPVEVKAGTLVLLHGANLHMSKENKSDKSRHAFSIHCVEGAPGFEYKKENWLQRKANFPFVPLYDDTGVASA